MEVSGAAVPMMLTAEVGLWIHCSNCVNRLPAMKLPKNTLMTCRQTVGDRQEQARGGQDKAFTQLQVSSSVNHSSPGTHLEDKILRGHPEVHSTQGHHALLFVHECQQAWQDGQEYLEHQTCSSAVVC